MRIPCRTCKTVTAMPPTSVLCSGTRTLCSRESCWRKVRSSKVPNIVYLLTTSLGIDVQAELRAKTGSPNLGPTRAPASATTSPNQPPLQQRAVMNRQQQRRSLQGPPKADGSHGLPMIQPDGAVPNRSPLSQPTPGSHLSSPATSATRSPNFMPQGTSVSPNFGPIPPQQQQQHLRPQPPRANYTPMMGPQRPSLITNQPPSNGMSSASTVGSGASIMTQSSTSGGPTSYFSTPYTDHMSQLGKLSRFLLRLLGIELCNPRLIP